MHERTSMVGITDGKWINLDQEQTQYVREVSKRIGNNEVKHVVLYGGHGSGKTVLGVQTAKIVLGNLKEESQEHTQKTQIICLAIFFIAQAFNDVMHIQRSKVVTET